MTNLVETQIRESIGFEPDAKIFSLYNDDQILKQNPRYAAAKKGHIKSAIRLCDSLPAEKFDELINFADHFDMVLPIVAEELQGDNAIPIAFAGRIGHLTGRPIFTQCFQQNKAYHTGADPMERLISRVSFAGSVKHGSRYLLIDDVTTMFSTLADCASYVSARGGIVVGAVLIANCSRSGVVHGRKKDISLLEERKYGTQIKELFHIANCQSLTYDEASYLVGFKTIDELRNRAVKAQNETERRIASKSLSRS